MIPFYNGEKYIVQAVESVLNQPYKNLEILLINDGSSGRKCCECLAEKDNRVRYFYKENEGIGATRNYGITKTKGQYIAFLDQDDIWVNNFLTDEIAKIILCGDDVIGFSFYNANNDFSRGSLIRMKEETIVGGGKIAQECCNHHSSMFYRRKFLIDEDIKYALTRHEDVIFYKKHYI